MTRARFLEKLLHPLCLIGGVILAVGFVASVIGLVIDIAAEHASAYQGLLTLVLFPSVSLCGLALILVGLWLEGRRARRLGAAWTPKLDVARPGPRRALFAIAGFAALFVVLSIIGAYHAYEFTESTTFCGALCHTPMEPQFVAHAFSPHANVACTTCHVGPGIHGYVEAKVSGVRQLVQMLGATYPRPIVAGHDKLLIAGQSCEQCHRPERLSEPDLDSRVRFGYDVRNSPRSLRLLLRRAGAEHAGAPAQTRGHWHAGLEITFRSEDPRHQEIPWVRVVRPDGTSAVYEDKASERSDVGSLPEVAMTCLDCHSRPAHRFGTPEELVNAALTAGAIDGSLPFIKKVSVEALARGYASKEAALAGIAEEIETFYRDHFDGVVLEREASLTRAIDEVRRLYQRNAFPEMRTDWSSHPDNTGHRTAPGCFRCHTERHVDVAADSGASLARDCSWCHVFFEKARDSESLTEIPADGSALHPFTHESHRAVECRTCHTDTASPYRECASCHADTTGAHGMRFECSICHKPGAPRVAGDATSCAPCHPLGGSALHVANGHQSCVSCHEPHTWTVAAASCAASGCHEGTVAGYLEENLPAFGGVLSTMSGLPVEAR